VPIFYAAFFWALTVAMLTVLLMFAFAERFICIRCVYRGYEFGRSC
jgi:hypothetical protein